MSQRLRRGFLTAAALSAVLVVSACTGSSGANSGGGSGKPVSGGTATFAEPAGTTPNYIFPMVDGAHYSVANIEQFERLMYRSLYWIGKDGKPVIDYSMSLAGPPKFSNHDRVVTITLNHYTWSDGQPVTARDVEFWINLLKANKANFAAYIPGEFPDNVTSTKVLSPDKLQLTLNRSYNPRWFTYDQLSQISPLPQHAWDKTSANGKVGNYDQTPSGAKQVYAFIAGQAKDVSTYGSNPLWKVVDGPWVLTQYRSDGYAAFVPNKKYSGPDKPRLAKFVEQPFTTESAELNVLRSGSQINFGYVPLQELSQSNVLASSGYRSVDAQTWGVNFFIANFNNPQTGPIISQPYVRQAMQMLIDQQTFIKGPLKGLGYPTCGPVPLKPASPYLSSYEQGCPFSFNPAKAISLLKSHGWDVHPNGVTTCGKPGSGTGECGQGVPADAKMSFNLQYASGNVSTDQEMQGVKSSFSKAGIQINLAQAPFNTVIANAAPCKPNQSACKWQMANWGGGWTYGVNPYPTGDQLFASGSGSNFSNYSDPKADALISQTLHSPSNQAMTNFENYMAQQMPVFWMPQPVTRDEISSNLHGVTPLSPIGSLTPERWYFTK